MTQAAIGEYMHSDPQLPEEWTTITTIDAHTAGEPLRVVVDGFPPLEGASILEKRQYLKAHHDDLRTALMWEPRGHTDMYGAVLTEPVTQSGDVGVLFTTNEGYSTMCGHGIIALGVVLPDTGMVTASPPQETITFETPAGLVSATAHIRDGRVGSVSFDNVPSFVSDLDRRIEAPQFGSVEYDLAYGGAFYAYCDADQVGLELTPDHADEIRRAGMAIKRAVAESVPIDHPRADDLGFLYGTIFRAPAESAECDSRNVCVFADGQIDRSSTGTGVSGRLAINHERGHLDVGEEFTVESLVGTTFTGTIVDLTTEGEYSAVVPRITGSAHVTGRHEFVIDPADPLRDGFRI